MEKKKSIAFQSEGGSKEVGTAAQPGPVRYSPVAQKPPKGGRGRGVQASSRYSTKQSTPQACLHLCTLLVLFNTGVNCKMFVEKGFFKDFAGLPLGGCAVFAS